MIIRTSTRCKDNTASANEIIDIIRSVDMRKPFDNPKYIFNLTHNTIDTLKRCGFTALYIGSVYEDLTKEQADAVMRGDKTGAKEKEVYIVFPSVFNEQAKELDFTLDFINQNKA